MIELEIDNKKVVAAQGAMIIEAADKAGIYIPRFCYHKNLTIAANCRMCLIEIGSSRKPLPACATPVSQGMTVFTQSKLALEAQRSVMEFLLINHPLDCPICDQGGECELQDLSLGYGKDVSRYYEGKRSVFDENLGPLISTEMTRCIQCTRCVRFGKEIAGLPELGVVNRGENLEISTYIHHTMRSELSGNIIDVCPVGALTSKPFRFKARAWELLQRPSIAPHDCVGSNLFVHTRGYEYNDYRQVMRVVPKENEALNETWLSDRDRFSYEAIQSADRLLTPKIKRDSQWIDVDWDTALNYVVSRWRKIIAAAGASQIGAIASPSSTLEEFYLLQKLFRALGSNNLDHRIRQLDFSQQENFPISPQLEIDLGEIEDLDAIFLVGSDIRREQPLICHRVRKAVQRGAAAISLNPMEYEVNFDLTMQWVAPNHLLPDILAQIAKYLSRADDPIDPFLQNIQPTAEAIKIAKRLQKKGRGLLLLGFQAIAHPQATLMRALAQYIATKCDLALGVLTEGANAAGAWLAGMIPHRGPGEALTEKVGLNALDMFAKKLRSYLLLNVEPELDCLRQTQAMQALLEAEFVVAMTPFVTQTQEQYADVLLPITPFLENSGTFVNLTNHWQEFVAVTRPLGEAKLPWKIFRVLGNLFALEGFDFNDTAQVSTELKNRMEIIPKIPSKLSLSPALYASPPEGLLRLSQWHMYQVDNFVRRSNPLQEWSQPENLLAARINEQVASQYAVHSGEVVSVMQDDIQLDLPVLVDNRVKGNYILLSAGIPATAGFGGHMEPIKLFRGTLNDE